MIRFDLRNRVFGCDSLLAAIAGLFILVAFAAVNPAQAQDMNAERPARLALFLDCDWCNESFIRQEIPYVDHMRDREVADVHVLLTGERTGAGGYEVTLDLIGLRSFEGMDFSTGYTLMPGATDSESRERRLQTLEAALVPYLMRTAMRSQVMVDVAVDPVEVDAPIAVEEDPWDYWTIEMYADGDAEFESQQRAFDTRYGVEISRVTDAWKLQLRPFFNYNYDRFERGENVITSTARRDGFTSYAVKSINPHWSVGGYGDILTSTFSNVDWRYRGMGAVEWSMYPYREANRRQLTVAYRLGASHITYRDTTIYGEIQEMLPQHLLNGAYEVVQPWGEIEIGVSASQYLDELDRYSLEFDAEFDIRVTRGLSIEIGGSLEFIHDQINLPKGDADLEEVLLRRRQLETNYEAGISFGFRYRFGSVFNNVVNPRFGGIGSRDRF